jgi:hypothetical protein
MESGDSQDAPVSKILHFIWSVWLLKGWNKGGCTADHWKSGWKGRSRLTPHACIRSSVILVYVDGCTLSLAPNDGTDFICIRYWRACQLQDKVGVRWTVDCVCKAYVVKVSRVGESMSSVFVWVIYVVWYGVFSSDWSCCLLRCDSMKSGRYWAASGFRHNGSK